MGTLDLTIKGDTHQLEEEEALSYIPGKRGKLKGPIHKLTKIGEMKKQVEILQIWVYQAFS